MSIFRTLPSGTVQSVAFLTLCLMGLLLGPVIMVSATVELIHLTNRRCPAPVEMRGSIAPERALVKLEMPEDAGR